MILATLFKSPLDNESRARGKRLSGIHRKQHPYTLDSLPRSSFPEHSHGTPMSYIFACSERPSHILLPQICWLPVFQACSFQTPHNAAKLLAKTHESDYNNTPGHFFSEKQCSECCAHWEDFPSPLSLRGVPESTTAIYFWEGPACHKEPSINQA